MEALEFIAKLSRSTHGKSGEDLGTERHDTSNFCGRIADFPYKMHGETAVRLPHQLDLSFLPPHSSLNGPQLLYSG